MFRTDLEEMYEYYIKNVSGGNYPISLELSRYLYDLCWQTRPKRILDRGSGFSSFVFRRYSLMAHCSSSLLTIDKNRWLDVYTVDNKDQWLDKTKRFLDYCGLRATNFYTWQEFLAWGHNKKKYDIILEDYNFPSRVKTLATVINMLADNGYLILDDANLSRYQSAIAKAKKRFNITVSYLIKETEDKSGRYSALIRKK